MNLRELCIKACNKDIISINILNDKKIKIIDDNIEKYKIRHVTPSLFFIFNKKHEKNKKILLFFENVSYICGAYKLYIENKTFQ